MPKLLPSNKPCAIRWVRQQLGFVEVCFDFGYAIGSKCYDLMRYAFYSAGCFAVVRIEQSFFHES
jgi:hypothetical protein